MRPVFILSLPRAGSTLLQRLLGAHPQISTRPEPSILLSVLYARRAQGAFAEYDHGFAVEAFDDLTAGLDDGEAVFDAAVRGWAMHFYGAAADAGSAWFLDKTPRYHLVAADLLRIFPDARFVFLWRNPLAVAASVMDSFDGGRWNLHFVKVDLYDGVERLVAAAAADDPRCCAVRYEDLVSDPVRELARVLEHLELEPDDSLVDRFTEVSIDGKGDPTGTKRYTAVTDERIDHWPAAFANPFRRSWARGYLDWIGPSRLAAMGYDHLELRSDLDRPRLEAARLPSDLWRAVYGAWWNGAEPVQLKRKLRGLRDWRHVHAHP
jgi:hypothetical protein